jgi:hypothetical protein
MASLGLQTPRDIGGCSLERLIIFYPSLIPRAIYDTPSIVEGTRRVQSMLRVNDDTRTRSVVEKSMIRIMASLREVRPLGFESATASNRRHNPGTVEAARRQLPSPGLTPQSSTGGHAWSISAYSASQGHSVAPKLQGLQRRQVRA